MEPTTQQRLLHGPQDAEGRETTATTDISDTKVSIPSRARLPDSNLAEWKQERLAHHHAYDALLIKAFGRWKQVTVLRKQRRQRVMEHVVSAPDSSSGSTGTSGKKTSSAVEKHGQTRYNDCNEYKTRYALNVRLRRYFLQWRLLAVERKQAQPREKSKIVSAEHLVSEHRLEVRGVRIHRDEERCGPPAEALSSATVDARHDLQRQREKKLRQIIVFQTQRQYLQLWRQAATTLQMLLAKRLRDQKADQFRVHSAWRRWRSGFLARSSYDSASRRAAFFLYYQLTKSSLRRLRAHADRQRRERGVSVIIEARVRRRTLAAVIGMWRQRLNTKVVFTHWREAVVDEQHHKPRPQHVQAVRDAVARSSSARLLRQYFSVWLDGYTRKQKVRALAKVLDGPLQHGLLRDGFKIWRHHATQQRRVQELVNKRNRAQVRSVWHAWSHETAEKQKREQQRRTAARFWYYRTLRKAFSALQGLRGHREELELVAERTHESRKQARSFTIFQHWREWSRSQREHRRRYAQATEYHKSATARYAFSVFRENVRQANSQQEAATQLVEKAARRRVGAVFQAWRAFYERERARNQDLSTRLVSYQDARTLQLKRGCFQALDENARSSATRRLVNAHARGHYQAKLLQRSFTAWISSVAQLKWEHIFDHRAQQFRDHRRKSKCFHLWKAHAQALRREREKTKLALHHWKKVRERKAFDAWKQYIDGKRRQRERMHAALEFRDRAHIRDGLSHWITGATHLAEQRSRRTVELQAAYTARVWGKVRDIAMHWRWLTLQSKLRDEAREGIEHGRIVAFVQDADEDHIVRQAGDILPPVRSRDLRPAATSRDHSRRAEDRRSTLSEFVMLPRNRPQPRKPVELILDSGDSVECRHVESEMTTETLRGINTRYGFHFPTKPTAAPLVEMKQQICRSTVDRSSVIHEEGEGEIVSYEGWTIDELEKRLLYWHDRRQRLKTLQQSLEDFRLLLQQASNEGNLPAYDVEHMKSRLDAMEQQEATSRHQWNESRPEILMLAERIKLLRATTTAVPA